MKTHVMLAAAAATLAGCAAMTPGPSGPITLTTASKAPHGSYIVDAAGRALYVLEGTRGAAGANRCGPDCQAVWPALRGAGPQVAGGRANQSMVAVAGGYGGPHVTYAGWPLYYYVRDQAPSDTVGQHVTDTWGTWHLLAPSGEPIRPGGGY